MVGGCCCMRPQGAIYITSGILIVGWAIQLIISSERFISAVKWSHDFPEERDKEGGTRVGVSGLLVIVDSSQAALAVLLLYASFLKDLNKIQPWVILSGVVMLIYVPLSIVSCLVQVTLEVDFVLSWVLILVTMYTMWLVVEFKRELSGVSLERLL